MSGCRHRIQLGGDFDGYAECALRRWHRGRHETFLALSRGDSTVSGTVLWNARPWSRPVRMAINWGSVIAGAERGMVTLASERGVEEIPIVRSGWRGLDDVPPDV